MLLHLTVLFHFYYYFYYFHFTFSFISFNFYYSLCVLAFDCCLIPLFPVNWPWGKALTNKMYNCHYYYYCYLWAEPPRTEWWADDQLWQKQGNAAGKQSGIKTLHCANTVHEWKAWMWIILISDGRLRLWLLEKHVLSTLHSWCLHRAVASLMYIKLISLLTVAVCFKQL